jgi:hypothetical protein
LKPDNISPNLRMLREPGLPPLFQNHGSWSTALKLPALAKLSAGLPDRIAYTGNGLGDGVLEADEVLVDLLAPAGWPTEMQLLNLRYLAAMDGELAEAVATAMIEKVPALRTTYDFLDDLEAVLPLDLNRDAIPAVLRLNTVMIHPTKSATPYLGLNFASAWDEEHGFGMMLYGTEPVRTGGGDVAIETSIGNDHAAKLRGG